MFDAKLLRQIALALVFAGALNWAAVGVAKTDLVQLVVGANFAQYVYILVGAAAVYLLLRENLFA